MYTELVNVLNHDAYEMEGWDTSEEEAPRDPQTLRRAALKIEQRGPRTLLTPLERATVRDSLLNEFEVLRMIAVPLDYGPSTVRTASVLRKGKNALQQAASLGIRVPQTITPLTSPERQRLIDTSQRIVDTVQHMPGLSDTEVIHYISPSDLGKRLP